MVTFTHATGTQNTVHLDWTTCISCGVPIAMPREMYQHREQDGRTFYCPNGHSQSFIVGETDEQKLRRQLAFAVSRADRLRMERDAESRSKAAIRGHLTRIKKRIANGVCPCCSRSFQNVARHMENQHPSFVADLKQRETAAS